MTDLFSLGSQYVSDFITEEEIGQKGILAPIELCLCQDCTLVQLRYTAPQEFLYTRHYWYRSGISEMMRKSLKDIVDSAVSYVNLYITDVVLDIGSNDGTLLRQYKGAFLKRIGIEPAKNLADEGRKDLTLLINDFWDYEVYRKFGHGPAKIVTAIGMFYDLDDPNKFIHDVKKVLHKDGVFIAQLMCLGNMLRLGDIGNLAHEHLEFYSLESLERLFDKYDLEIFDIERNNTNGESYRLYIRHIGSQVKPKQEAANRIHQIRLSERDLSNKAFYKTYFAKIEENKRDVVKFIKKEKEAGKTIWVYGASTKGNVILQYYGLDNTIIDGARDKSPEKWGKYTIGSNIKIYSPEEARAAKPDYFLVLPYAFIHEFIKDETEWLQKGGKFIVPLPQLRIFATPDSVKKHNEGNQTHV